MKNYKKVFIAAMTVMIAMTTLASATELTDAQVEDLFRRSYQYVAMYNVNNKFALRQGGWNTCIADTQLKDHTMREIARPNNDTLYISCMLDLRKDPMVLEMPAIDSKYVSLMITGYDHHVNIPMASRLGDFQKPEKMLVYTSRTEGYKGEKVRDREAEEKGTGRPEGFPSGSGPAAWSPPENPPDPPDPQKLGHRPPGTSRWMSPGAMAISPAAARRSRGSTRPRRRPRPAWS